MPLREIKRETYECNPERNFPNLKELEESLRPYSDVLNSHPPEQQNGEPTFSTVTKYNIRSIDTKLEIDTTYKGHAVLESVKAKLSYLESKENLTGVSQVRKWIEKAGFERIEI